MYKFTQLAANETNPFIEIPVPSLRHFSDAQQNQRVFPVSVWMQGTPYSKTNDLLDPGGRIWVLMTYPGGQTNLAFWSSFSADPASLDGAISMTVNGEIRLNLDGVAATFTGVTDAAWSLAILHFLLRPTRNVGEILCILLRWHRLLVLDLLCEKKYEKVRSFRSRCLQYIPHTHSVIFQRCLWETALRMYHCKNKTTRSGESQNANTLLRKCTW